MRRLLLVAVAALTLTSLTSPASAYYRGWGGFHGFGGVHPVIPRPFAKPFFYPSPRYFVSGSGRGWGGGAYGYTTGQLVSPGTILPGPPVGYGAPYGYGAQYPTYGYGYPAYGYGGYGYNPGPDPLAVFGAILSVVSQFAGPRYGYGRYGW